MGNRYRIGCVNESIPNAGEGGATGAGRPWWLVGVGVIAFFLHGASSLTFDHEQLSNDEREYVTLAKSLADEGRFVLSTGDAATRMPLYPLVLSFVYRTQNPKYWLSAVDILQSMMGVMSAIGLACIAARLADARAGILAGLTAAFYAPFMYLESQLLTETLALLLMVLAIWLYVAHCMTPVERVEQRIAPWGVSVLLGLAVLTRANAALLIVPFVVHAFVRSPAGTRRGGRVLAMVLPAALIVGGWMARNQAVVGKFTLSTIGGLNFYLGHNPMYREDAGVASAEYDRFNRLRREGLTEAEADEHLYADGLAFVKAHPGEVVGNWFRKVYIWFVPTTRSLGPSLLLLVSAAVIFSMIRPAGAVGWVRSMRVPLALVWAGLACWYAVWAYGVPTVPLVSSRYLLPLGIPAIFLFRPTLRVRGLFIGLLASQLFVAMAYIPISRLRWVMDALLIVALAVCVSNVCVWMRGTRALRDV